MIVNEDGEKCSAKELAQDLMLECLTMSEEWIRRHQEVIEKMTDRELTMLNDQIQKLTKRAAKAMGVADRLVERSNDPYEPLPEIKDAS